jgi:hypothetical protein
MRSRSTIAGHVPTSWAKPYRSTIVMLAVAAAIADGFVWLTAPEGMLDTRLAYGPQHVRSVLVALGEGGREAYRLSALVDLSFIALYTALLVNWVRFFRNRKIGTRWARPALGLLPGAFDLIETLSILGLLHLYPAGSDPLVFAAVVATPLKWISLLALGGMILAGEVGWWRKRRSKGRGA